MSKSDDLKALGEFGLIDKLSGLVSRSLMPGAIGIGDDCAVLPLSSFGEAQAKGNLLVTTDAMVEGVHFRRQAISSEDLGYKILAISISDIAAMGGQALWATLSLHLPSDIEVGYLEGLYSGLNSLAEKENISIVGGDTVAAAEFSLSLTLIGCCQEAPILRSGAKVGDELWLSGELGHSGLGLALQEGQLESFANAQPYLDAHHRPDFQSKLGVELGKRGIASSMIDISDGFLQDLGRLAHRSGVEFEVDLDAVPVVKEPAAEAWGLKNSLTSGEDYQLLFTVSPRKIREIADLSPAFSTHKVGEVTSIEAQGGIYLLSGDSGRRSASDWLGDEVAGFDHFSN